MAYEIISGIAIFVLVLVIFILIKINSSLKKRISGVLFDKQSLSVKYGKMTEQFMPFLDLYPYNQQNFRFIGSPVDGIQFENDKIVFVEFKTSESKLSDRQKIIKELVENKKVKWEEIRIKQS